MGWIFTIAFLISAAIRGNVDGNTFMISSALFAIAGSLGSICTVLNKK